MAKRRIKVSRAGIAIALSALEGFSKPKVSAEQYMTEPDIAATILWDAYMKGDISGKRVADLGSGTGVLGIGAILLGAAKVFLIEQDKEAMEIAKENLGNIESESSAEFVLGDVKEFSSKVDTVIMNPPFGTKSEHSDKRFLENAFDIGNVVYSLHKTETKKFIEAFAKDNKFKITQVMDFSYPLKATMDFHSKGVEKINVSCFRFVKDNT
ncbi:MAG: METTL5 family protein [Nanoarchaeota archaeon]|nr:METTL5 family protein [Nanoarchaeota archaeon]MBU1005330.1 METTL5 family protein [Nanoarchaeota archaeon]MBU1945498.1 METTL5 family protein [Nanoarchaeota archaeon]